MLSLFLPLFYFVVEMNDYMSIGVYDYRTIRVYALAWYAHTLWSPIRPGSAQQTFPLRRRGKYK